MYIKLDEVAKLKADVRKIFSSELHYHDTCGGMYFSLDEENTELMEYLIDYFRQKNLIAEFSDNGREFNVHR